MKWQVKFLKNALFGLLPFPLFWRRLKRTFFPYDPVLDEWTLEEGIRQLEMLRAIGFQFEGKVVMEIGAGWKPVIPLLFYLVDCREIIMVDTQKLLDKRLFAGTARRMLSYATLISKRLNVPVDLIAEKLSLPEGRLSEKDLFEQFRMKYLAPFYIGKDFLPKSSVDLITSRAVFEHIHPRVIEAILEECRTILKDDGAMCHVIDNSDHWEHDDKTISRLNFLKFSKKQFDFISFFNPLDYQNRLRHCEYLRLFDKYAFRVVLDKSFADDRTLIDLAHQKVAASYMSMKPEELAILTSYVVVVKEMMIS